MAQTGESAELKDLLSAEEYRALQELKRRLLEEFPVVEELTLFGSVARGEADEESDIDLLVLTSRQLDRPHRHEITGVVCEVNLEYETNFSTLVVDREEWDTGMASVLSVHHDVEDHGVPVGRLSGTK